MVASEAVASPNCVAFTVRGKPKGQPRARAFAMQGKAGGKPLVRMYDPSTAEGWKSAVIAAGCEHRPRFPIEGAVEVTITFRMPRPKSLMRKKDPDGPIPCVKKPDVDNLAKAVLDAMTVDGWWRDDGQVCRLALEKRYHAKDAVPGCDVTVSWGAPIE